MQAGQKIRDYILEERIGAGGVGEVWRARHEHLNKHFAIKALYSNLSVDSEFRERFLREARAMGHLEHPNILMATDFFTFKDDTFLVMPYIEGGSLRALIDQRGVLPLDQALQIAHEVLVAVDFAHRQGIIHRDIKPSNILLHNRHPVIMDFGIAKLVGSKRLTDTTSRMGTTEYMSPEQIQDPTSVDQRSDEYAVACLLYEMLSGQPPFGVRDEDVTDISIMYAHVHKSPKPLRKLNPGVDERTEAAVMRALAKNPGDRFGGCHEMSNALPVTAAIAEAEVGSQTDHEEALGIQSAPVANTVGENDPNEGINSDGETPLMVAARSESLGTFKALLQLGGDISLVDRWGETITQKAKRNRDKNVLKYIESIANTAGEDGSR